MLSSPPTIDLNILINTVLEVMSFETEDPRAIALKSLVMSVGDLGALGMLHPEVVGMRGPFSKITARRIHAIGRLAMKLEGGQRSNQWSRFRAVMAQGFSSCSNGLMALGGTPRDPTLMICSEPQSPIRVPSGSVFARILEDGIQARALILKCPRSSRKAHLNYGWRLFETSKILGLSMDCVLLLCGGETWAVAGHLSGPGFVRFLTHWCPPEGLFE